MSDFYQDVRYAVRLLVKQPGFTILTIFILALGIGATTAIFSVVDTVLLRPLPYAEAPRLVGISNFSKRARQAFSNVSAPDFHDWHDQAVSFDGMAAYYGGRQSVTIGDAADYASVIIASPDFFPVLSARTALGRLPSADEQQSGGTPAAVVSYAFWRSHFGGDPTAIGRTLKFRERVFTVVGVLAPAFRYPANTDIWVPWWVVPETPSRSAHNYLLIARLKPGVTVEQAQSEMDGIAARLEQTYPQSNENKGVLVQPLQDLIVSGIRTTLNLIFGVVIVVLLIACANVSNLLLARATSRTRELGVRAAIGATRRRMVRQLVTESALLAIVAGGLGVLIAAWGIRGLLAIAPPGLPRLDEVGVDLRILGFAVIVSLTSSFVFGLAPAVQTSGVDLNEVLKQAGRGAGSGSRGRLRASLIVFETAAAVVLVIAASLLIRSFAALTSSDLGFQSERLLLVDTNVPSANLEAAKRAIRFYRDLLPTVATIPGVEAAAMTSAVPTRSRSNGGYAVEGERTFEQMRSSSPQALFIAISPNYFKTLGVRVVRGRDFTDADVEGAPLTLIINETLARAAFGDADPIGRRIMTGLDLVTGPDGTRFATVVGVAADLRGGDPSLPPQAQLYFPFQQHPFPATAMTLVFRTPGDPKQIANAVVQRIRAANPDVPARISTMEETLGVAVAAPRFRTVLLVLSAGLALVLAMAGVYGVVSFTVAQRTSELGLRMALGAQRSEIVRLVLSSGLRLTAIGLAVGWIAALALSRLLESMLFQTAPRDPLIFVTVPAALLAVAALACAVPAIRASRVEPSVALRVE